MLNRIRLTQLRSNLLGPRNGGRASAGPLRRGEAGAYFSGRPARRQASTIKMKTLGV